MSADRVEPTVESRPSVSPNLGFVLPLVMAWLSVRRSNAGTRVADPGDCATPHSNRLRDGTEGRAEEGCEAAANGCEQEDEHQIALPEPDQGGCENATEQGRDDQHAHQCTRQSVNAPLLHRQNRKSLPECIVSVFLLLQPKRARIEEDLTKARKTAARRAAKLPPKGAARNATTKLPCQNQNRVAVSIPPSRAETSSNRIEALIGTRSDRCSPSNMAALPWPESRPPGGITPKGAVRQGRVSYSSLSGR